MVKLLPLKLLICAALILSGALAELDCSLYTQYCCRNAAIMAACKEHCRNSRNSPCNPLQNVDAAAAESPTEDALVQEYGEYMGAEDNADIFDTVTDIEEEELRIGDVPMGSNQARGDIYSSLSHRSLAQTPEKSAAGQSLADTNRSPRSDIGRAVTASSLNLDGFKRVTLGNVPTVSRQEHRTLNNQWFHHCCEKYGVPAECWMLCFYGPPNDSSKYTSYSDWQTAMNTAKCSLQYASVISYCASQNRNNKQCCQQSGIGCNCLRFCDVTGAGGIKHFSRTDIKCIQKWDVIVKCHESSLDTYYPGPNLQIN